LSIEEAKQSPDLSGVPKRQLVAKVMKFVAIRAEYLPVFWHIVCSVVVSVMHMENENLLVPSAAFALTYNPTVVGAVLPGALLGCWVTPRGGVEGAGALPAAEAAVLLPACRTVFKRRMAPFARTGFARFLVRVSSAFPITRAASDRAVLHLAPNEANHELDAAFLACPRPSCLVSVVKTAALLRTVTLASVCRKFSRALQALPIWFHGEVM